MLFSISVQEPYDVLGGRKRGGVFGLLVSVHSKTQTILLVALQDISEPLCPICVEKQEHLCAHWLALV